MSTAVAALAELAAEHEVVVTHGNGPPVGALRPGALRTSPRAEAGRTTMCAARAAATLWP